MGVFWFNEPTNGWYVLNILQLLFIKINIYHTCVTSVVAYGVCQGEDVQWQSQLAEVVQEVWAGAAAALRDDKATAAVSGDTAGVNNMSCT